MRRIHTPVHTCVLCVRRVPSDSNAIQMWLWLLHLCSVLGARMFAFRISPNFQPDQQPGTHMARKHNLFKPIAHRRCRIDYTHTNTQHHAIISSSSTVLEHCQFRTTSAPSQHQTTYNTHRTHTHSHTPSSTLSVRARKQPQTVQTHAPRHTRARPAFTAVVCKCYSQLQENGICFNRARQCAQYVYIHI